MMQRFGFLALVTALALAGSKSVFATPYASNVVKTGTTVNFILNEPADTLKFSINGGALQPLDGTTKGGKTFNLTNASDTFSIVAEKNAAVGFLIPTGVQNPGSETQTNQWTQPSNGSGFNVISDDANLLARFNSPRGLDISRNPNSPNFGTAYISNSAAGALTVAVPPTNRTLGDGLYAIRADQSDAFGYVDTAQNPNNTLDGFPSFVASTSSPYRIFLKQDDGDLYVSDYSDANGQVFKISPNLTSSTNVFAGFGGPAPPVPPTNPDQTGLPAGQNHGSISQVYVEGSLANNNLVVYGMDEDLNTAHVTGVATDPKNDRNSLWKWNVGGALNHSAMPTKVSSGTPALIGDFPAGGITVDMTRGSDGKFYMSQLRSTTTGVTLSLIVTDPAGAVVYDSLTASRTLLNDPAAKDILTNNGGIDISPDGKWLGIIINSSDVGLVPLVNGIPDLANRLIVDSSLANGENTGRDIAFDAAGNLHYVSSGQQRYRALSPGGNHKTTLVWNGTTYSFTNETIAVGGITGDYNNNGVVDAADYVVWRNAGPTDTLPNDPTAGVSAADYDAWRANFGKPPGSGSGAAVPEPATVALLALGLIGACSIRKRNA